MLDTVAFLRRIWPKTGWYCIAVPQKKGYKHHWYATIEEAARAALSLDAGGFTVYHACSTFTGNNNRRGDNAHKVKAFWMDLDVGDEPNKFVTKQEALRELRTFLDKTRLPTPLLIDSGGGYHCYWALTEEILPAVARGVGRAIKALAAYHGFRIDPSRTADLSSVLRPVGTHNRKYAIPVPIVRSLNDPPEIEFTAFAVLLESASAVLPKPKQKDTPGVNAEFLLPSSYAASDPELVADKCQQLRPFRDAPATVGEPIWYAGIQVLHFCTEGDATIHAWSSPHPDYDAEQTAAKIAQIESFGPTACTTFESRNPGGCIGCPYKGKITSPVQLGVERRALDQPPVVLANDVLGNAQGDATEALAFIPPPLPFKRTEAGVYFTDRDGIEIQVHEYDLFVTAAAFDHHAGYEICYIQHWLPQDGWKVFSFRSSAVSSDRDFEQAMRDHHVRPTNARYLRLYVALYLQELQRHRKLQTLFSRQGWVGNSFVLGKKLYKPGETAEVAGIAPSIFETIGGFEAVGDLTPWAHETAVLGVPGMEAHAFTFCSAFGAPLMRFTGLEAALLSTVGPSNAGKSTMAYWGMSAFGDWRRLKNLEVDTDNTKMARMGAFGSLLVYIDEITNKDPKKLSDFVYQVTQGREKGRMRDRGGERPTHQWNTLVVSSSNSSLTAKLSVAKANATAELYRVFEYHVGGHPALNRQTAQRIHDVIIEHHGVAGEQFIRYIVDNQVEVRTKLRGVIAAVDKLTDAKDAERFWSAAIGCVLFGAIIARKLGLIAFDPAAMWPWVVATVKTMREERKELYSDEIEVLGRYLNEFANARVTVEEDKPGPDCQYRVLRYPVSGQGLHSRFETVAGVLYIERRHFHEYVVKQHEDMGLIRSKLLARQVLLGVGRKSLGQGTGLASASVECWKIDMKKPDLGNVRLMLAVSASRELPEEDGRVSEPELRGRLAAENVGKGVVQSLPERS